MIEHKTAEIKFRIEPSVKARWQAQAAAETDGNLSELITKAMDQHSRKGSTTAYPRQLPTSGSGITGVAFPNPFPPAPRQGCPANGKPCNCTGACMRPASGATVKPDWTFEGQHG